MKSMTGFAQGRTSGDSFSMFLSMKSLNHRYQEIYFKGSGVTPQFEKLIKETFKEKVSRGKIEVVFDFFETNPQKWDIQFNEGLLEDILNKVSKIKRKYKDDVSLSLDSLLRYPMILHLDTHFDSLDAKRDREMKKLVRMVFADFLKNRTREGNQILNDLLVSIQKITEINSSVAGEAANIEKENFRHYRGKISRLLKPDEIDDKRVAQEAAISAEKTCIVEEINRLSAHNKRMMQLVKNKKISTKGRELDFLCQEMLRETFTIASKINSLKVHDKILLIRREIEKMRQQIQNVE
jgi:uncharacterized protein (TIGR00255 family)